MGSSLGMRATVWGSGFGVRVQGLGFRDSGSRFIVLPLHIGLVIWGLGCRDQVFGTRICVAV